MGNLVTLSNAVMIIVLPFFVHNGKSHIYARFAVDQHKEQCTLSSEEDS